MKRYAIFGFAWASLAAMPLLATTASQPREVLPFIADDYPRALAAARAQTLPIFVEAWAPW